MIVAWARLVVAGLSAQQVRELEQLRERIEAFHLSEMDVWAERPPGAGAEAQCWRCPVDYWAGAPSYGPRWGGT